MERRRIISLAGAAGVGILLPYSFYRYIAGGLHLKHIGVSDFLDAGPEAALRAITPAGDFYLMSSNGEPRVDAAKWSLTIDGLVEQPLRFSYDVQCQRRLSPSLRTINFCHATAWDAADASRRVQAQTVRGNGRHVFHFGITQPHHRPFAKLLLNLTQSDFDSFVSLFNINHAFPSPYSQPQRRRVEENDECGMMNDE